MDFARRHKYKTTVCFSFDDELKALCRVVHVNTCMGNTVFSNVKVPKITLKLKNIFVTLVENSDACKHECVQFNHIHTDLVFIHL